MKIEIDAAGFVVSAPLRAHLGAVVAQAFNPYGAYIAGVRVRLSSRHGRWGETRYTCVLSITLAANGVVALDAESQFPHAAVEQATEQAWDVLRREVNRIEEPDLSGAA